jgi:hypothetical protein
MPFAKSVQRVLAGSLNYSTRPTELPDNDAQKLTNFAFDQEGGLRSRKGHTVISASGQELTGTVKQIIHALGTRWVATTDAVFQVGSNGVARSVLPVPNAHIVGFKGFVWAVGGGQAKKTDGTNNYNWIPEAPKRRPRIRTALEATKIVADFTQAEHNLAPWTVVSDPYVVNQLFDADGMQIQAPDNA